MKKRVLLPLMLCLALALAFGMTACGGTGDAGTGNGGGTGVTPEIPDAHVVLYAAGEGETTGTLPEPIAVHEDDTFTVAANALERVGYTFAGWSDGSKTYAAGDTYTMGTANVTLTAQWTVNEYSVTYAAGSEDAVGTLPTQADVAYGAAFTVAEPAFTATPASGYTFAGWSDGTTTYAAGDTYTMGAADVTLTAVWMMTYVDFQLVYTGTMELGSDTFVIGRSFGGVVGTYTFEQEGSTVTLTEQLAEGEDGDPQVITLTARDGFLTGTTTNDWGVTQRYAFYLEGSKVLDSELCGQNPVMSYDQMTSVYLYTDGTALYSYDYNSPVEAGTYTEENMVIDLIYGADDKTLSFKITLDTNNVRWMTMYDGLDGTYTVGEMTLVLDGYLGGTFDGAACEYAIIADNVIYTSDESGNPYIITLDTSGNTGTASENTAIYNPTEGGMISTMISDGTYMIALIGSEIVTLTNTDGTYSGLYQNNSLTATMSGDTITVTILNFGGGTTTELEFTKA